MRRRWTTELRVRFYAVECRLFRSIDRRRRVEVRRSRAASFGSEYLVPGGGALSPLASCEVSEFRTPQHEAEGFDGGSSPHTWTRPDGQCPIDVNHTPFNGGVRPRTDGRTSQKQTFNGSN